MLVLLNLLQLVLYVALLALLGQAALHVLAGARRESNVFYGLLRIVARPFTALVRRLAPRQVADAHVPLATFLLLGVLYAGVTLAKIDHCVALQMVGCK